MKKSVIIVGAGMGGLTAAIRLKQRGFDVLVLEARNVPGGLASGLTIEDFAFDAGPYILLDRAGLEWIFNTLKLNRSNLIPLIPVDPAYEVQFPDGRKLRFFRDLDRTAEKFEENWTGSGTRYRNFVQSMHRIHDKLRPMLYREPPGILDVLRSGIWRQAPFLFRSLRSVLAATHLPNPIQDAISIWTHVAGQTLEAAPSPMAFVPAMIHSQGAYYPEGGIRKIPEILSSIALTSGVEIRFQSLVRQIVCKDGRVQGVLTEQGEFLPSDIVLSNAHGIGTYLNLVPETPVHVQQQLTKLPLQSPGICLYLAAKGGEEIPYLSFLLPGNGQLCRLRVMPESLRTAADRKNWEPVRMIAPLHYRQAEKDGADGQRAFAQQLLTETWWQHPIAEYRLLQIRTSCDWSHEHHLYRNSMNPVMTARAFRNGRLAHRSPYIRGLYLAGSSTNPGQWVSFCGISGILAADCVTRDFT